MTFDEWHEKAPIYSVTGAHEAAQMAWDHQQEKIDKIISEIESLCIAELSTTTGKMRLLHREEVMSILNDYRAGKPRIHGPVPWNALLCV